MVYHWASKNVKQSGYDDMVLLPKINEQAIYDNLKKRLLDNYIYTYIGPVLIAVNPYKQLPYFTDAEIEQYKGATQIENPPHIYAIADFMYRNMLIEYENQCVIISGESGAGKTVSAKYIMNYVSKVSGGNQSSKVQNIKNIILQSNPLLEAFGNAKTLRNNNSSRFGKYVEIQFKRSGEPEAGRITNFLLEKSRVVGQTKSERSFHIFYQLCSAKSADLLKKLGIVNPARFNYLNKSGCYEVEDIDDKADFEHVLSAMKAVNISEQDQNKICGIIAGILHLGNIGFKPDSNHFAQLDNLDSLEYPAFLLGINKNTLKEKLVSRTMETKAGARQEKIDVTLNVQQAEYTRDALAKGIYSRLFDYLVEVINKAMQVKDQNMINIGILDIYGFEIFEHNGFEQFCINYVNEKLQQIFIELTLKAEQEEYRQEGIKWTDIDYFNNKIVCDLIESKIPPGIFSICDDVVITMHATSGEGVDNNLLQKLGKSFTAHPHFSVSPTGFLIKHYAGDVSYNINGYCEKNRDVLFQDLIDLMRSSSDSFVSNLFPDQPTGPGKRPSTAASKIKSQANQLVDKLMKCYPSYIRCIKPNEAKQANTMDEERVKHQIKYLGLVENIKVRRAGFAYRREFTKFVQRYGIVSKETKFWTGPVDRGIQIIMNSVNMDPDQWQMGKSKVFIKSPESLFLLEEVRDRKYNEYAVILQRAFRKFNSVQYFLKLKNEAADLLYGNKERRALSLNRKFYGDYIDLNNNPKIRALVGKRENIEFAQTCWKLDRRFKKQKRDLVLTNKALYLIGREVENKGDKNPAGGGLKIGGFSLSKLTGRLNKNKNQTFVEVIKQRYDYGELDRLVLSGFQDNFVAIFPKQGYPTILEIEFKTEFLTTFSKRFKESMNGILHVQFSDSIDYQVKKENIINSGGPRTLKFLRDITNVSPDTVQISPNGKACFIKVKPGLPNTSRPMANYYAQMNFEQEPWWPKFEQLKSKYGITIVKGDHKSRNKAPKASSNPKKTNNSVYNNQPSASSGGVANDGYLNPVNNEDEVFSNLAPTNQVLPNTIVKPPVKQRKPKQPEPNYPKCRALYSYSAAEADELSFNAGDVVYIVKEDPSGWWTGLLKGNTGLFPSNYFEKI